MESKTDADAAPVDAVVMRAVCDKWLENQANIAGGKGTWPNPDYVRDATWDGWIAVQSCLRSILLRAGIDPYDSDLPA